MGKSFMRKGTLGGEGKKIDNIRKSITVKKIDNSIVEQGSYHQSRLKRILLL